MTETTNAGNPPNHPALRDGFMALLGAELLNAGPGTAVVAATVRAEHLNFHGSCHGGFSFALADMAFGIASNFRGSLAVGIDAHMAYLAPASEGDLLTATASEISRTRRLGTYAVEVVRGDGRQVARFTGTVILDRESAGAPSP